MTDSVQAENRIRLTASLSRYEDRLIHLVWISPLLLLAGLAWLGPAARPLLQAEPVPAGPRSVPRVTWPEAPDLSAMDWSRLRGRSGAVPAGRGSLAARFRLAGTFFAFGGGSGESRKAVLDDLETGSQRIVGEGDAFEDVSIVSIYRNRIVLRSGQGQEELWLGFARGESGNAAGEDGARSAAAAFGGRQVGEQSWVFQRDDLLDYYSELMDEPERLVTVFDSLEPLYQEDGSISGYRLNVKGEREFFEAAGMQPGDVVRKVNSMAMTSRRRAEYFIREFVADRANAFVLEIERNGEPQKLVYQVR